MRVAFLLLRFLWLAKKMTSPQAKAFDLKNLNQHRHSEIITNNSISKRIRKRVQPPQQTLKTSCQPQKTATS